MLTKIVSVSDRVGGLALLGFALFACGDDDPSPSDDTGASTMASSDDGSAGSDGESTTGNASTDDADSGTETGGELADFEGASEGVVHFAIETAMGLRTVDAYVAMIQGETYATANMEACPTRVYDGSTMTMTADACTTDGATFDGTIVATNAVTFRDVVGRPTYDPDSPMQVHWQGFSIDDGENRVSFDGVLDQSSPEAAEYDAHSVLTIDGPELVTRQDIATTCTTTDERRVCAVTAGWAEIDGVGGFSFEGEIGSENSRFYGWVTLTGEQTVQVDLDTVVDGCHPYTIDGAAAGMVCLSLPDAEPLHLDLSYGGGCLDGDLVLEATVDLEVDAMTLEYLGVSMDVAVVVPLSDPTPAPEGGWTWHATVTPATRNWSCDELETTSFRVIGQLDDRRDCQAWGPGVDRFPANCADW